METFKFKTPNYKYWYLKLLAMFLFGNGFGMFTLWFIFRGDISFTLNDVITFSTDIYFPVFAIVSGVFSILLFFPMRAKLDFKLTHLLISAAGLGALICTIFTVIIGSLIMYFYNRDTALLNGRVEPILAKELVAKNCKPISFNHSFNGERNIKIDSLYWTESDPKHNFFQKYKLVKKSDCVYYALDTVGHKLTEGRNRNRGVSIRTMQKKWYDNRKIVITSIDSSGFTCAVGISQKVIDGLTETEDFSQMKEYKFVKITSQKKK